MKRKSINDPKLPDQAVEHARRVWSQANYVLLAVDDDVNGRFEHPVGVSRTVPDQSLSIKQLFERHKAGLTIPGHAEPVYSDDDTPMFERMDFADRMLFLEHIREHKVEIKKEIARLDHEEKEKVKMEEQLKQEANDKKLAEDLKRVMNKEKDAG